MGESWTPLLALAFDLGCDLVMTDWEAEIAQAAARGETPNVTTKSLSPDEAWAML